MTAAQEAQTSYTEAHQAYETAAAAEEQALETYETASENLETAQTNNDRTADQLEQAQVQHEYSNDSSQQTIESYQEQIESCTVTAPISGVITAMNVEVGDTYMGENSALFSVADNENFVVSANVDEYDISSISEGMEAAVIVEALGEDELPATVSFVSRQLHLRHRDRAGRCKYGSPHRDDCPGEYRAGGGVRCADGAV